MIYLKLSTAIDQYISSILPTKSQSQENMQTGQLRYWKSKLGDYRINQITPEMISSNLPDRSPATKNRYLSALSSVYNNNGQEIKVKRYREKGRVRFLSSDERTALLQASKKSSNPHLYCLVVLSLSTGARQSEALKLEWNRVDLDRGLIYLTDTKNNEPRMVPIGGHALELIEKLPRTSKYVFPSKFGSYYRDMDYHWRKVLGESGITDFRWHDMRHTAASYLSMAGVDLPTIGKILGHKSLSSTMRYVHLSVDHLRGVLGNLNDMMFP